MKRWATLKTAETTQVVDVIVEQNEMPVIPGEWVEVTGVVVGPGWLYDGNTFSPPPPPPEPEA